METRRLSILAAAFILLTAVIAHPAAKKQISNTRTASCLVKITADSDILPLNVDTIASLIHSSGVGGKAVRDVLDLSLDSSGDTPFYIEPLPSISTNVSPKLATSQRVPLTEKEFMAKMMDKGEGGRRGRIAKRKSRTGTIVMKPMVSGADRTFLFHLTVNLSVFENAKPAAKELLVEVTDNLKRTLTDTYKVIEEQVQYELNQAENQLAQAQSQLSETIGQGPAIEISQAIEQNPADAAVYRQLEKIVDLSELLPAMPFHDAIEKLRESVKPPLRIFVNWRDLSEVDIDKTTPINMDAIPAVPLGRALKLLLTAVSGGYVDLDYIVTDGVITIATPESLPRELKTRVYEVSSVMHGASDSQKLIQVIVGAVEPDSWFDAGGEGTIDIYQGKKLIVRQLPEIHEKLRKFLESMKIDAPLMDTPQTDTSVKALLDRKQDLTRDKQELEMDIARQKARRSAIELQITKTETQIKKQLINDPVITALQEMVNIHVEHADRLQSQSSGVKHTTIGAAKEKIGKAKIELAKRREQIAKSAGGRGLMQFNNQLTELMIDIAEQKAVFGVINNQLSQIEGQLAAVATFDPQLSQIRLAKQAFDIADRRVSELKTRIANLQPPMITVIGAE